MSERTTDEVAQIYNASKDSVTLINSVAAQSTITDEDKATLKRNVDHIEIIKAYKDYYEKDKDKDKDKDKETK